MTSSTDSSSDGGEALMRAQAASQRDFYRALASGAHESHLATWPGVQATLVPIRPWFSILNSVLFEDQSALDATLPDVELEYRTTRVNAWRVWVSPDHSAAESCLKAAGYQRGENSPMLMAAPIDSLDLVRRTSLDLVSSPTWDMVARCNDQAYGILAPYTLAAAFRTMNDPASRLYAARAYGEVASVLVTHEHDGDCYSWFVATLPRARGQGLASELMRHALRDARARGCATATLESSSQGESVYRRLGFRALGRFSIWERQVHYDD